MTSHNNNAMPYSPLRTEAEPSAQPVSANAVRNTLKGLLHRTPRLKREWPTHAAVTIHLGLHKTASTFLQQHFFPLYSDDLGYLNLRTHAPGFLAYLLHCNDLEWDPGTAISLLEDELRQGDRWRCDRMLISDEQLCGSPWDNVASRKCLFDRLHHLFPEARYFIVFRNQQDLVQSLYLQYVKMGGSASWKQFLTHDRHPLKFALGSYLNYGAYLNYIIAQVGKEMVTCFLYEDMKRDPMSYCTKLAAFLQVGVEEGLSHIVCRTANKSLSPFWTIAIIHANKFFKSERQPFLLFPRSAHRVMLALAIRLSFSRKKSVIPESVVGDFCREAKSHNSVLRDLLGRDLSEMGY